MRAAFWTRSPSIPYRKAERDRRELGYALRLLRNRKVDLSDHFAGSFRLPVHLQKRISISKNNVYWILLAQILRKVFDPFDRWFNQFLVVRVAMRIKTQINCIIRFQLISRH